MSSWGRDLYLCKLESPCPKVAPYQISMHLSQWFLRRRFFNIPKIFPILALTGPEMGQPLDLSKLESPFSIDASYHTLL